MEKRIQSLLQMLRIESCVSWLVVIIVFVLGLLGVIVNGSVQPNTQKEFVLNTIGILSTLLVLPLALKLFLLNTTRSLRRMNNDEALDFYHVWSLVRLVVVTSCIAFNVVVYFMTMNMTGLLCALIGVCITIYCLPTKQRIVRYLDEVNNDLVNQ
jgi:SNF family Na+-dependent transporter